MQVSEIRERFSQIEQSIDDAAQACRHTTTAPEELRSRVNELDREADQVRQLMASENDENRLRECVDRLEEAGDRAMQACRTARNLDQQLQVSLSQAHYAISTLKQQLH
jgi:chromosome segregation ATPase